MFVSGGGSVCGDGDSSPDGPCVDAARDLSYCPDDPVIPQKPQRIPKAAPRTQPPTPKPRSGIFSIFLPTTQLDSVKKSCGEMSSNSSSSRSTIASATPPSATNLHTHSPRTTLRLITVDLSLFEDDDFIIESATTNDATTTNSAHKSSSSNQPYLLFQNGNCKYNKKDADDNSTNNENNQNNINTVLRRTTYDLATQCESRRASMRRHTIIGCNQNYKLDHSNSQSMPPSRPASRQSDHGQASTSASTTVTATTTVTSMNNKNNTNVIQSTSNGGASSNLSSMDSWAKNSLDEQQWKDTFNLNDRLSLTLEEIVHIRSVMTKAELEGLPVDIHIKDDVEQRKVCFLCMKTRFTLFVRGILCKLCQRKVCNKCFSKMRIPTEHFRNVPVVLLSPSLMSSPCASNTTSPSHHAHHGIGGSGPASLVDESFPRSLMERLLRPELDRKTRNTVGSAPSSPKNQRSTSSTPGSSLQNDGMSLSLTSTSAANITTASVMSTLAAPAASTTTSSNGVLSAKDSLNFSLNHKTSLMSRSMEGPNSLPPQSPARPHSNNSTLDRRNRFSKAFTLSAASQNAGGDQQKERLTGELMAVCNDCRSLVLEIIRSSRQTRSTARNHALRSLTLDLSPVYKRC